MEKILTDPDLMAIEQLEGEMNLRKKNLKIKYLEQENLKLLNRTRDLEESLSINKEIICALVDTARNEDYKTSYELFQSEI
jgi:hypothetical protein